MKDIVKLGWIAPAIAELPPLLDAMAAHPLETATLMMFLLLVIRKQP